MLISHCGHRSRARKKRIMPSNTNAPQWAPKLIRPSSNTFELKEGAISPQHFKLPYTAEVPQAESHPSKYTDERVGKSVEYVNQRLGSKMRKPSPIQEKALLVYKGACQDYLEARKEILPEGRRKEMLSEIRQYEIEISDSGWVKAVGSEARHEF